MKIVVADDRPLSTGTSRSGLDGRSTPASDDHAPILPSISPTPTLMVRAPQLTPAAGRRAALRIVARAGTGVDSGVVAPARAVSWWSTRPAPIASASPSMPAR